MSGKTKRIPRVKPNDIKIDTDIKKKSATTKRNRPISSSPESTPPKKLPTTTTMPNTDQPLTIDAIRSLLAEQTNSLQTSILNEMKALGEEIKSELQAKITQLNDKIDTNQHNVQQQINELKSNVTQCMEQATGTDDDMQRVMKLNELKISGIAYKSDENLTIVFSEIAKIIQFNLTIVNNLPTLTRIFKRNRTTNTSTATSIVIVKFVANHIRNEFYQLYLNKIAAKQPIMSENIGLLKGTQIIIGENLTAKNFGIFVEAGKQKKQGKLCQVFTQEGLVHVKAVKNTKSNPIRSLRELELFLHSNPLVTQHEATKEQMDTSNNTTANTSQSNGELRPTQIHKSQNPVNAVLAMMQFQQQQQQQK